MGKLGTLSWLEQTGGRLGWQDRLTMIAQGVRARAETRRRLALGAKVRNLEVADVLPPDSALVREALMLCREASKPYLFNHCIRAYFWARLLDDQSKRFDNEATFVALLLHDLGLTDAHRLHESKDFCFTIVGAKAVEELGTKHGWPDHRVRLAAEAIALHLNVTVGDRHGREAQLVRMGSGADVAGLGLDMLQKDQIDDVVKAHPRHGLKREIATVLTIEADQRPGCRIHFMNERLGFQRLVRSAPYFTE
jgi:hypothetical protein